MRTVATILCTVAVVSTSVARQPPDTAQEASRRVQRGLAHAGLGDYKKAVSDLEAAYRLQADPLILYHLADVHRSSGNRVCALELYRTYLASIAGFHPAEAEEHRRRALDLQKHGDYKGAAAELEVAYSLYPDPDMLRQMGDAYRLGGDRDRAIDRLRKYIHAAGIVPRAKVETIVNELEHQLREGAPRDGGIASSNSQTCIPSKQTGPAQKSN
jgi:tetratricopeptide (TPR) repeat protein